MSEESNRRRLEKKHKDKKPNELVIAVQEGVEALKEGKQPKTTVVAITDPAQIQPGKLRQRIKSGEVDAKAALAWLKSQECHSEEFETWLTHKASGFIPPATVQPKKSSRKKKKATEEEKD